MQFTPLLLVALASSASAAPTAGFGLPKPSGVAFPGAPADTPTNNAAQEAPAEFFTKGKGAFIQEKPTRSAFGGFPGGSFPTGSKFPLPLSLPSDVIGEAFPTGLKPTFSLPSLPTGKIADAIPTGSKPTFPLLPPFHTDKIADAFPTGSKPNFPPSFPGGKISDAIKEAFVTSLPTITIPSGIINGALPTVSKPTFSLPSLPTGKIADAIPTGSKPTFPLLPPFHTGKIADAFPTGSKPTFSLPPVPTGKIGDEVKEAFGTSLPKITIPSGIIGGDGALPTVSKPTFSLPLVPTGKIGDAVKEAFGTSLPKITTIPSGIINGALPTVSKPTFSLPSVPTGKIADAFPTGSKPTFPPPFPGGKIGDAIKKAFGTSLPKITIPSIKGFPPIPTGNGGFGLGGGPKIGFPTTFKTLARPTPSA